MSVDGQAMPDETGQVAVIEFSGLKAFVIVFMYDGNICNRFFDKWGYCN